MNEKTFFKIFAVLIGMVALLFGAMIGLWVQYEVSEGDPTITAYLLTTCELGALAVLATAIFAICGLRESCR